MEELDKDIKYFNAIQSTLQAGKWVLIHDQKLISVYDSFEKAAEEAVRLFKNGPYLIRQVGAPPITLPASVVFRVHHHG